MLAQVGLLSGCGVGHRQSAGVERPCRCNVVAAQGGGIQRNAHFEPLDDDVRAEATQRAWVALLSAWGDSVGYQGGRNARIVFWRPPSNPPAGGFDALGHVPSRAARLTLRGTRTHSRPLWRRRTRWRCESRIVRRS